VIVACDGMVSCGISCDDELWREVLERTISGLLIGVGFNSLTLAFRWRVRLQCVDNYHVGLGTGRVCY
jgi:hypothetical protein